MAIENMKSFNVRIKNKYDSYENWAASNLILEAGEIAICHTTVDVAVDNGVAKHPALLMKVGDGEKTFANLPWMSAKAADVLSVCKDEEALTEFVNSVIADAGIASDDAMQALAGRVTTAEGEIDALQAALDTAETGLKARVTTAEGAIAELNRLVGDTEVHLQIDAKIAALNLADTYAAKTHGHAIADVEGLADSIAAAKKAGDDAAAALGEYKTLNDAAVKVNSDAITAIKDGATIDSFADVEAALAGKQATGDYSVVGHKHEIADVNGLSDAIADAKKAGTDAATAAGQALIDAKAYTDTEMARLVGDDTVKNQIDTALEAYTTTTDMTAAIATAKGEAVEHANGLNTAMDARVQALEAIDHTHTFVESELNLIQAGDVAKWNDAEKNAKDYADGLDGAMNTRVEALEAKFTGEDSVADQIADAVAAETELREAADKALQEQIGSASAEGVAATGLHARIEELERLAGDDTVANLIDVERQRAEAAEKANAEAIKIISDDYLKASDKTELQGNIDTLTGVVETLRDGIDAEKVDGVKDLIDYVDKHGAEVTGMKADIKANADAIGKATEGETAGTGLYKRIEDAEADIATKAAQADLTTLAGRVTTVEGDLNAENTGLKARMTAAEGEIDALQSLVGDSSVDAQIKDALQVDVDGVKVDKYALATDLAAAEQTHATDKAALEGEIAKKANTLDLADIAKTGSTDDLIHGTMTLVFDCGGAGV